jgi:hypothetical protein|tara:strand:- start:282 stop:437 length:156 start_codon:yes stop_codon:yes gene_type:complete
VENYLKLVKTKGAIRNMRKSQYELHIYRNTDNFDVFIGSLREAGSTYIIEI